MPALAVMTTRFVSAASLMCRVLGRPDYEFAVIAHPISSATDAELMAAAASTLGDLKRLVVRH